MAIHKRLKRSGLLSSEKSKGDRIKVHEVMSGIEKKSTKKEYNKRLKWGTLLWHIQSIGAKPKRILKENVLPTWVPEACSSL